MNNAHVRPPLTRRGLLKGLTAFGAAAALGQGVAVLAQTGGAVRIGVLLPLTGDADSYAQQMRLGIESAVAEINEAGGVLGRALETAYRDSETTPNVLPGHCRELVQDWGAAAVIGPWAAAGRRYAARTLAKLDVPLLNGTNHEGGFCNPALFSLGPTMAHDSQPLVRYLDATGAGKKYFLLGSYPSWQNSMFRRLRFTIGPLGGHVQGQALTDGGERNFRPVIRWIQESDAEVVMFCVTRHHGREFIHQARDMGLLDQVMVGWIGFNETLADGLGRRRTGAHRHHHPVRCQRHRGRRAGIRGARPADARRRGAGELHGPDALQRRESPASGLEPGRRRQRGSGREQSARAGLCVADRFGDYRRRHAARRHAGDGGAGGQKRPGGGRAPRHRCRHARLRGLSGLERFSHGCPGCLAISPHRRAGRAAPLSRRLPLKGGVIAGDVTGQTNERKPP